MTISTIFFDADGTLLDFRKAELEALKRLMVHMKIQGSPEDFINSYHRINDKIWLELEEGIITAEELKSERFRRVAREMNWEGDPAELSAFYLRALGEGHFTIEGAGELLESLKGKFRLVMITNGLTLVQEARFGSLGYDSIFDEILISEKEGVAKPDVEIFRRAAERLGIELDDKVLMVGDSLTSDIAGGIAAGIRTCWFNPEGWENQSPHKASFETGSLDELSKILNSQVQATDRLSR